MYPILAIQSQLPGSSYACVCFGNFELLFLLDYTAMQEAPETTATIKYYEAFPSLMMRTGRMLTDLKIKSKMFVPVHHSGTSDKGRLGKVRYVCTYHDTYV